MARPIIGLEEFIRVYTYSFTSPHWETDWMLELPNAKSSLSTESWDCALRNSIWEELLAQGYIFTISWAKQPLSSRNAQNRSLKQGMPLHVALGEENHACKFVFLCLKGNQTTQLHMQENAWLLEKKVHFWLGVELVVQKISTIYGLSTWMLPRFTQILGWIACCWENFHKSYWEGWLAGLHNLGAQQDVREDYTISRGKASFPPEMHNFQGEAT